MRRFSRRASGRIAAVGAISALAVGTLVSIGAAVSPSGTPAAASQYLNKVTICHHTHSQANPTVTITVSRNAIPAHMRHGDTMGPCAAPAVSAKVTKAQKAQKPRRQEGQEARKGQRVETNTQRPSASTAPGRSGTAPGASGPRRPAATHLPGRRTRVTMAPRLAGARRHRATVRAHRRAAKARRAGAEPHPGAGRTHRDTMAPHRATARTRRVTRKARPGKAEPRPAKPRRQDLRPVRARSSRREAPPRRGLSLRRRYVSVLRVIYGVDVRLRLRGTAGSVPLAARAR